MCLLNNLYFLEFMKFLIKIMIYGVERYFDKDVIIFDYEYFLLILFRIKCVKLISSFYKLFICIKKTRSFIKFKIED